MAGHAGAGGAAGGNGGSAAGGSGGNGGAAGGAGAAGSGGAAGGSAGRGGSTGAAGTVGSGGAAGASAGNGGAAGGAGAAGFGGAAGGSAGNGGSSGAAGTAGSGGAAGASAGNGGSTGVVGAGGGGTAGQAGGGSGTAGQAGGGSGGVAGGGGQAGSATAGSSGAGGAGFTGVICGLAGYWAYSGDFDGDGTPDCALLASDKLSFYKGVGGGMYQTTPVTSAVPCVGSTLYGINYGLPAADLDGDGRDDIVTVQDCSGGPGGTYSCYTLLLGRADGTFQCPSNLGVADAPNTPTISGGAVGDFTNDGHQDIFLVTLSGRMTSNQVQWVVLHAAAAAGSTQLVTTVTMPGLNLGSLGSAGPGPGSAQFLDGDSNLDVVVGANFEGMLDLVGTQQTINVYGNGDGTFHCGVGDTLVPANPTANTGHYVCQSTGVYTYQP